jgi:hypothetical protein
MMHDRMSRGPHAFRKSDLERALKAAKAAGYTVVTIDAKTGTVTATAEMVSTTDSTGWDEAIEKLERPLR